MNLHLNESLKAFSKLGQELQQYLATKDCPTSDFEIALAETVIKAGHFNTWFTPRMIHQSFYGIAEMLNEKKLRQWTKPYFDKINNETEKTIAVVAAGNIPLVAFHDFLSVLVAGHNVVLKLSSDDKILFPQMVSRLCELEPRFSSRIFFTEGKLEKFDAVIATGSNNTSRYFEYYFKKYPHIIRKNRTSLAVLTGEETDRELLLLAEDVFNYFGLGCRNVSKVYLPVGFDIKRLFKAFLPFSWVMENNRYMNNYSYNKTLYMMNREVMLDNEFIILKESSDLHAPVGVLYYEYYTGKRKVEAEIDKNRENIQCIVGRDIKFGHSQTPRLEDYADHVNTLDFLVNIT